MEIRKRTAGFRLAQATTNRSTHTCPDFTQTFILQTDTSNYGIGAVLTQQLDGVERLIAYVSRRLNSAESNYSVTEKECRGIGVENTEMCHFLEAYNFVVVTNHLALKWLNSK